MTNTTANHSPLRHEICDGASLHASDATHTLNEMAGELVVLHNRMTKKIAFPLSLVWSVEVGGPSMQRTGNETDMRDNHQ